MDVTIYSLEGVRSAVSQLLHATEHCCTLTEEKKYYIRLLLNETINNAFCHSGQSCAMLDWTIRNGVLIFRWRTEDGALTGEMFRSRRWRVAAGEG